MANIKKGFKGSLGKVFVDDTYQEASNSEKIEVDSVNEKVQANPQIEVNNSKARKSSNPKKLPSKKAIVNGTNEKATIKKTIEEVEPIPEKEEEQKYQEEPRFVKITVEVNAEYVDQLSREVFWERTTMKAIFDEELSKRYEKQKFDAIPVHKMPTKRGPKPKR